MQAHFNKPHRVTIHHKGGSVHYTAMASSTCGALSTAPTIAESRGIKAHVATATRLIKLAGAR